MKRCLFLKVEYLEVDKKMSKAEENKFREQLCKNSVKEFKKEMKSWIDDKSLKILKDLTPEPQVIIECEEDKWEQLYVKLCAVDIVETIDSILPKGEA